MIKIDLNEIRENFIMCFNFLFGLHPLQTRAMRFNRKEIIDNGLTS